MRWLIAVVALGMGCYQPTAPSGAPCSPSGACPRGQSCVDGLCRGEDDLPDMPDAAQPDGPPPDAPPGTTRVLIGLADGELADTMILGGEPGNNFGDYDHIAVDADEVSLVRFELAAISTSATVVSATLRISSADYAATDDGTVTVHRMREPWIEGEATWLARSTGLGWLTEGAAPPSRDASPIATLKPGTVDTSYEVDLPISMVQAWISTPAQNHGIALVRGTTTVHVHLASRERDVPAALLVDVLLP